MDEGVVRVFRTKNMKGWVTDITEVDIETRAKDLKVGDGLVNRVVLKDGTKGWVWSKNETFK